MLLGVGVPIRDHQGTCLRVGRLLRSRKCDSPQLNEETTRPLWRLHGPPKRVRRNDDCDKQAVERVLLLSLRNRANYENTLAM